MIDMEQKIEKAEIDELPKWVRLVNEVMDKKRKTKKDSHGQKR